MLAKCTVIVYVKVHLTSFLCLSLNDNVLFYQNSRFKRNCSGWYKPNADRQAFCRLQHQFIKKTSLLGLLRLSAKTNKLARVTNLSQKELIGQWNISIQAVASVLTERTTIIQRKIIPGSDIISIKTRTTICILYRSQPIFLILPVLIGKVTLQGIWLGIWCKTL